jgi:hypothetical protein
MALIEYHTVALEPVLEHHSTWRRSAHIGLKIFHLRRLSRQRADRAGPAVGRGGSAELILSTTSCSAASSLLVMSRVICS